MANFLQQVSKIETRNAVFETALGHEVRFSTAGGDDGIVEGVAVSFDTVDTYKTTFDRRAFAWNGKRLPMFWSHRSDEVVGSVHAVSVENEGLLVRGKLNMEVQRAREIRSMLIAGDISGLSIGFRRLKDEARSGGIRHITQAELMEVSFVAMPSVPGSRVTSVRAFSENGRENLVAFNRAVAGAIATLRKD